MTHNTTPTDKALEGTVFAGRFAVERKLGEGGMGEVYLATDQLSGERVALKVLLASLAHDQKAVKRFEKEAQAVRRLNHTNIVSIRDFGRSETGRLYMSMEFLDGDTVFDILLRKHYFSWDESLHVATGIGRALAEAHGAGVVHRDLKPDNVMLLGDHTVKVLDFGLAMVAEAKPRMRLTESNIIMGTPGFMSPEQIDGAGVDARSDLYALGILWWQMLVGRAPFEGDTPIKVMMAHVQQEARAPTEARPGLVIPRAGEEMILRLLAKRPDDRPHDGGALVRDIEALNAQGWQLETGHLPSTNAPKNDWDAAFGVAGAVSPASGLVPPLGAQEPIELADRPAELGGYQDSDFVLDDEGFAPFSGEMSDPFLAAPMAPATNAPVAQSAVQVATFPDSDSTWPKAQPRVTPAKASPAQTPKRSVAGTGVGTARAGGRGTGILFALLLVSSVSVATFLYFRANPTVFDSLVMRVTPEVDVTGGDDDDWLKSDLSQWQKSLGQPTETAATLTTRAQDAFAKGTTASLRSASDDFRRALLVDRKDQAALAGLLTVALLPPIVGQDRLPLARLNAELDDSDKSKHARAAWALATGKTVEADSLLFGLAGDHAEVMRVAVYQNRDPQRAHAAYKALAEKKNAFVAGPYAASAVKLGFISEAKRAIKKRLALDPADIDVHIADARIQRYSGNYARAIRTIDAAVTKVPSASARMERALSTYARSRDARQAAKWLTSDARLPPRTTEEARAVALYVALMTRAKKTSGLAGLAGRSDDAHLLLAIGTALSGASARSYLKRAEDRLQDRRLASIAALHLGELDLNGGDVDAALLHFTRALEHDPQNAHAALGLALAQTAVGNDASRRRALTRLLYMDPEAPWRRIGPFGLRTAFAKDRYQARLDDKLLTGLVAHFAGDGEAARKNLSGISDDVARFFLAYNQKPRRALKTLRKINTSTPAVVLLQAKLDIGLGQGRKATGVLKDLLQKPTFALAAYTLLGRAQRRSSASDSRAAYLTALGLDWRDEVARQGVFSLRHK